MVCDTVYRFRCRESVVKPEYLEIALNAPSVLGQIYYKKTGNVNSGVNLTQGRLMEIVVPVPSITTQESIIEVVERSLSIAGTAEQAVLANMKRAERLRQSILEWAIVGRLVPQDPSDEPADKLLERIGQRRPATNGSPGARKRRRPRMGGSTLPLFPEGDQDPDSGMIP